MKNQLVFKTDKGHKTILSQYDILKIFYNFFLKI